MKGIKYCVGGLLIIIAICLFFGGFIGLLDFASSGDSFYSPRQTEAFGLDIPQWIVRLEGIEGTFAFIGAFAILVSACVGTAVLGGIIIGKAENSEKEGIKMVECPQCKKKFQV